jgi:hypothetical protein
MIKLFYNPYNGNIFLFSNSHTIYYHNKKLELPFDEYIRGLIKDDILYLRIYYPYNNIDELTYNELMNKSNKLLNYHLKGILQALKHKGLIPKDIILNVTNEDLKRYLNLLYV